MISLAICFIFLLSGCSIINANELKTVNENIKNSIKLLENRITDLELGQKNEEQNNDGAISSSAKKFLSYNDLIEEMNLDKKAPGTKIYYSSSMGLAFTYRELFDNQNIKITESGNNINIDGQNLYFFEKDPELSLVEALTEKFLIGYKDEECFAKQYESKNTPSSYVKAGLSPAGDRGNGLEVFNKCPLDYGETNGARYFLMDNNIPEKFFFVELGQAAVASDGTIDEEGNTSSDWSNSIKIFK